MTDLHLVRYNDREMNDNFKKFLNLKVLKLNSIEHCFVALRETPALSLMTRLSKLVLSRLIILKSSLVVFETLSALNILELSHCLFECDWADFAVSLSRTPVKNFAFENLSCQVEDIESLLNSVQLDYLYLTNFRTTLIDKTSQVDDFRIFAVAFHCKRENPRVAFLFEQGGYARNHNGVITD